VRYVPFVFVAIFLGLAAECIAIAFGVSGH
jgi:hypothetical protein